MRVAKAKRRKGVRPVSHINVNKNHASQVPLNTFSNGFFTKIQESIRSLSCFSRVSHQFVRSSGFTHFSRDGIFFRRENPTNYGKLCSHIVSAQNLAHLRKPRRLKSALKWSGGTNQCVEKTGIFSIIGELIKMVTYTCSLGIHNNWTIHIYHTCNLQTLAYSDTFRSKYKL